MLSHKKQNKTQKLVRLKKRLAIIIMINTLLLQNLIIWLQVFTARLAQENLVANADFANKLKSLNKQSNSNKTKSF